MAKKKETNKIEAFLLIVLAIIGFVFGYGSDLYKDTKAFIKDIFHDEGKVVETLDKVNVKVYFIDVGEADSILIDSNGKYILIDAGNNKDGPLLVDYFKELGIKKFDYVIGTHAHEDHIGGMDYIIRNFDINHFYMPKTVVPTYTYEDVVKELKNKSIKYTVPKIGTTFTSGKSEFEVLSVKDDEEDLNNGSIVLRMKYKDVAFMFMADVESPVEEELIKKSDISADVIKIGHHGSRYGSTSAFLNKVGARYAVISVGKLNDYNHPHNQALKRIEKAGLKLYRTDLKGTIIFNTDGKNFKIETVKTKTNMEEE